MKKFNKIFISLVLVLVLSLPVLSGCSLLDIFNQNNSNISSIDVVGEIKTEYMVGENFEARGAKVKVTYKDGNSLEIPLDRSMTDFDSSTVGNKFLEVTYSGKVKNLYYYVNTFKLGKFYLYYQGYVSNYSPSSEQKTRYYIELLANKNGVMLGTNGQENLAWDYYQGNDSKLVIDSIDNAGGIMLAEISSPTYLRVLGGQQNNYLMIFRYAED